MKRFLRAPHRRHAAPARPSAPAQTHHPSSSRRSSANGQPVSPTSAMEVQRRWPRPGSGRTHQGGGSIPAGPARQEPRSSSPRACPTRHRRTWRRCSLPSIGGKFRSQDGSPPTCRSSTRAASTCGKVHEGPVGKELMNPLRAARRQAHSAMAAGWGFRGVALEQAVREGAPRTSRGQDDPRPARSRRLVETFKAFAAPNPVPMIWGEVYLAVTSQGTRSTGSSSR